MQNNSNYSTRIDLKRTENLFEFEFMIGVVVLVVSHLALFSIVYNRIRVDMTFMSLLFRWENLWQGLAGVGRIWFHMWEIFWTLNYNYSRLSYLVMCSFDIWCGAKFLNSLTSSVLPYEMLIWRSTTSVVHDFL